MVQKTPVRKAKRVKKAYCACQCDDVNKKAAASGSSDAGHGSGCGCKDKKQYSGTKGTQCGCSCSCYTPQDGASSKSGVQGGSSQQAAAPHQLRRFRITRA